MWPNTTLAVKPAEASDRPGRVVQNKKRSGGGGAGPMENRRAAKIQENPNRWRGGAPDGGVPIRPVARRAPTAGRTATASSTWGGTPRSPHPGRARAGVRAWRAGGGGGGGSPVPHHTVGRAVTRTIPKHAYRQRAPPTAAHGRRCPQAARHPPAGRRPPWRAPPAHPPGALPPRVRGPAVPQVSRRRTLAQAGPRGDGHRFSLRRA